ncbi:hypothetical protein [Campylobacter sp. US33a]|uniref:hypothetical protein n=1 Tax=Campylobacter sp. US33a TaxID=2498120 RepID=UPI001067493F|nr:hypothetical protein [Campylobacter sp. US33a]TEY03084.1 hypothetical protein ELQ16_03825 [Campylobacter sp. US33a]
MDFLDSLKDIKKSLEKEQKQSEKPKNKSSKSGVSLKNDLTQLGEIKAQISQVDKDKKEFEEIFLKEEKLIDEFENFIKNSDIKRMK